MPSSPLPRPHAQEGHPLDAPHALRRDAARVAAARIGADASCYNMLVRGADQIVRFHGVDGVDASPIATRTWRDVEGLAVLLADGDLDHVAPFNELGQPPDDYYATAFWRGLFDRVGYRAAAFTNVTTGTLHRGHVLFLRATPGFWELGKGHAEQVAGDLALAFKEAWELEEALVPPDGSVTIRPDGSLAATPALAEWIIAHDARPWLQARASPVAAGPTDTLGCSEVSWAPGAFLRAQLIPGGGTLLSFARVAPLDLPPVLIRLTALQRRVASLAAAGATAVEIARELGRSPETVREHLSRIYARLGVASRSELATLCRRMLV